MATIPCTVQLLVANSDTNSINNSTPVVRKLDSQFMGMRKRLGFCNLTSRIGPNCGSSSVKMALMQKVLAFMAANPDDFDRDDVKQYSNYMGMLAVEGTYDKMEALLCQNIHPVDILLMMASSEGDKPKIEELLRAGAKYDVKDADGKTAIDKASSAEIKNFILSFSIQKA